MIEKKFISSVLGQNGFIMLNKSLIKYFESLELTCVLSFLIDKSKLFNFEDFYYTIENLKDDTSLSERALRLCLKKLIDENILIKKEFTGLPPKQYYNLNYERIITIISDSNNPVKSDSNNPVKSDRVKPVKSDSVHTIYNNNKDKKNKVINNKDKKNIKKSFENQNIFFNCDLEAKNNDLKQKELKGNESIKQDNKNDLRGNYEALNNIQKRQVKKLEHLRELGFNKEPISKNEILSYCEALYNANERLLFSIDVWLDWVEYKLSRDKKAIWTAYKANFDKLLTFGNLAELSILNSINSNWQGLFKPSGYEIQEQNYSLRYQGDNKQNEDFIDELLKNGYYPSQAEREAREKEKKENNEE